MAVFNPQIQTAPIPDYTNVSRPISQPEADKSKGIMLAEIGEGITGVTSLVERTAQDYLKEKVQAGVDTIRGKATLDYETILAGNAPTEVKQSRGYRASLVSSDPDVPEALEAGIDRATNLVAGRSQSRMNDTLYTAQLNALAKQLRSEYPGHRDFIDEQIAKISGKNPANAYMENLMQDINRSASSQDVFQKMILRKAESNMGQKDVQFAMTEVQMGRPGGFDKLTKAVYRAESDKAKHEQWARDNAEAKGDSETDKDQAESKYIARTTSIINQAVNPLLETAGLTPAMINKLVSDENQGKITLTEKQKGQLVSALSAFRNEAMNQFQDVANSEGYARRIRNPNRIEDINKYQIGYIDRIIDALTNDKYGSVGKLARELQASQNTTASELDNTPLGEKLRQYKVISDKLGPTLSNFIDSAAVRQGIVGDVTNFLTAARQRATVADDIRKDGVVKSLYSDLEKLKQAKANGYNVPAKAYDNLVENVNIILEAAKTGKTDVAKEVVKYMFDPDKNQKLMTFFGRDFYDSQNNFHKGRFATYDILTQDKVVDAIYGLGDKEAWAMFKDFQRISIKSLFGEDIKALDDLQKAGDSANLWKKNDIKLSWDDDNQRMEFKVLNPPKNQYDMSYVRQAQDTVDRVNGVISNIAYTSKKEGSNVTEKVFDTLLDLGFSPNDRFHGDNFPQRLIEAIKMSQDKAKSPEEHLKETFEKVR